MHRLTESSSYAYEEDALMIPILQTWKLSLGAIKQFDVGRIVSGRQSQELNPACLKTNQISF